MPTDLFADERTLRLNDTTLALKYYGPAHTDSDISVYFKEPDVLHTADTFWNGIYPFIDYSTGGSIDGSIRAAEANLEVTTDKTIIIPGHGRPVSNRSELAEFRDMLVGIRANVAALEEERTLPRSNCGRQADRGLRRQMGQLRHRPGPLHQAGLRGRLIETPRPASLRCLEIDHAPDAQGSVDHDWHGLGRNQCFGPERPRRSGPLALVAIENEPPAKLIVDPPLPGPLALGRVFIQYRAENLRIVPVFGAGALDVSPRIGHVHITVDDAPWHFVDASGETIILVGLKPGPHKVLVELADPTHRVSDSRAISFVVPQPTASQ